MSIEMFIKFPGILITIGVVLLLLSIILGLIAYKKDKNGIGAGSLSNSVLSVEEIDDEKPPIENTKKVEVKEVKEEEKETFTFPKEEEIEDIKTEPIPLIKEVIKEQEVVLEEPKEEIKEVKQEIKEEPIKEEKTTLIYGGVEPTKKFNFSFNSEKGTYEDNKTEELKIELPKEKEVKIEEPLIEEVKDEAEEDIEIL